MPDISKMQGVRVAIERVLRAVRDREKIILFGDGDLDGIASIIILKEALEILESPPCLVYFSSREECGHGLNEKILHFLREESPALIITLDCGITNLDGVRLANEMGFEVIIIDHHCPLGGLPQALAIINPKQKKDFYPFKDFCAAGLVYKFSKALLGEAEKGFNPERFLELAMLATIFDQVPQAGENKEIIEQGMLSLFQTKRIGLNALIQALQQTGISETSIQYSIISALSAGKLRKDKSEAFLLLTEKSFMKSKKRVEDLLVRLRMIKEQEWRILEEARSMIDSGAPIIFIGSEKWPLFLAARVASRLCQEFDKPTFLYSKKDKESQGSIRTPKGINSLNMIYPCAKLLINYGGHPQASGFGLKNEDISDFKKCILDNFENL